MIATADLKQKVVRMWGNPSTMELSPQTLKDAIEKVWNIVTMESSIISPMFLAKFSETFTLSKKANGEYSANVNISDLAVPIAVEHGNGSDWSQVDSGSIENWDYYIANNIPVALVTGLAPALIVRTNFSSSYRFRLRYISDGQEFSSDSQLPEGIILPSFFQPMFEYGVAAECADGIITERAALASQIDRKEQKFTSKFLMYLDRYKDWLRSSRSPKGVSYRTPSNASRRGGCRITNRMRYPYTS